MDADVSNTSPTDAHSISNINEFKYINICDPNNALPKWQCL